MVNWIADFSNTYHAATTRYVSSWPNYALLSDFYPTASQVCVYNYTLSGYMLTKLNLLASYLHHH